MNHLLVCCCFSVCFCLTYFIFPKDWSVRSYLTRSGKTLENLQFKENFFGAQARSRDYRDAESTLKLAPFLPHSGKWKARGKYSGYFSTPTGSVGVFSLGFRGLCSKVMAGVERLEAEQSSGSTGDGFLLSASTSCTHMLVNLSFSGFPLRNTSVLVFCRKPGLSLPFLLGLPTSRSQLSSDWRAMKYSPSSFPPRDLTSRAPTSSFGIWGSHLCFQGATWWLRRGLPAAFLQGARWQRENQGAGEAKEAAVIKNNIK